MDHEIKKNKPYSGSLALSMGSPMLNGTDFYSRYNHQLRAQKDMIKMGKNSKDMEIGLEIARKSLKGMCKIPRFRLDIMRVDSFLGKGSSSTVWKANFGGQQYAVKQFSSSVKIEDIWKERDFLIRLKGPRIVNLVSSFYDKNAFLVMELCFGTVMALKGTLSTENKTRFCIQLVKAVRWMHSRSIIHCDIRPPNLLITTLNNLVLADFDQALHIEEGVSAIRSPWNRGSYGYQDFESNILMTYSKSSDMFSVACCIFELWTDKYLLKYRNDSIGNQEYGLAFQKGRCIGIGDFDMPVETSPRELLTTRVRKATKWAQILCRLVVERQLRLTAEQVENHSTIQEEYDFFSIYSWKLDNGDDCSAQSLLYQDTTKSMVITEDKKTSLYHGFYYDELEKNLRVGSQLSKLLPDLDPDLVSNHMIDHRLVSDLLHGLCSKDSKLMGRIYLSLVEFTESIAANSKLFAHDRKKFDERDIGMETSVNIQENVMDQSNNPDSVAEVEENVGVSCEKSMECSGLRDVGVKSEYLDKFSGKQPSKIKKFLSKISIGDLKKNKVNVRKKPVLSKVKRKQNLSETDKKCKGGQSSDKEKQGHYKCVWCKYKKRNKQSVINHMYYCRKRPNM